MAEKTICQANNRRAHLKIKNFLTRKSGLIA